MPGVVLAVMLFVAVGPLASSTGRPAPVLALEAANAEIRQTREEAIVHDTALIAEARGWSIAEAEAHLHAAAVVGEIAAKVAANRPDAFVGSALADDPRGAPVLYIKGPADPYVWGLAREADIAVVVADNQPFTLDELEARSERVLKELRVMGFDSVSIAIDIKSEGMLRVGAALEAGAPTTRSAAEDLLSDDLRDGVDLHLVAAPTVDSELNSFGGMRGSSTTNENTWCTTGWTVSRLSDGLFGTSTAGHCQALNQVLHPGHGEHTLVFRKQHAGAWGDVEWYSTAVGDQDDFYASGSIIRDVAGTEPTAAISVGEAVCFYGRTSNFRDCTLAVMFASISCDSTLGQIDRMVLMDGGGVAESGDSGGGFSVNYTAYGLMHGGCPPDFPYNPITGEGWVGFSVADLLDEALGVYVYPG